MSYESQNDAIACAQGLAGPGVGSRLTKRIYDVVFSSCGLVLLSPLLLLISAAIKVSDRGPVFYRQWRVGYRGRQFQILKFRTMVLDAEKLGPSVTKDGDQRITRVGRFLRRTKLDELPQLLNVLRGEMSFVGPRPEVPRYVARYTEEQRQILNYQPGITDLASLVFRDEESLLANAADVEEFYLRECVQRKCELNVQYARVANVFQDTLIILQTLCPYWLGIVCLYSVVFGTSLMAAYALRFDFQIPAIEQAVMWRDMPWIVAVKLLLLLWRRHFSGLVSYFSLPELKQISAALGVAAAAQVLVWYASHGSHAPARGVIVIDALLSVLLLAGLRLGCRYVRRRGSEARLAHASQPIRVAVIGAGDVGAWVARELNVNQTLRRKVEVFFDDNPDTWQKRLHNIPVAGMPECITHAAWAERLDEVIIAMPDATSERLLQISRMVGSTKIRLRTVPSLNEILL